MARSSTQTGRARCLPAVDRFLNVDSQLASKHRYRRTSRAFRRGVLHYVIDPARTLNTVFVGAVLNDRMIPSEIVERRGRSRGPFKRRRFPRILGSDGATESAPDQIPKKNELRGLIMKSDISRASDASFSFLQRAPRVTASH